MSIRARKAEIDRRNKHFMLNTRWLVKFFAPTMALDYGSQSRLGRLFTWEAR